MSNPSKRKGTEAETAVTLAMRSTHWPSAERRTLSGSQDKGDINTGNSRLVIEVKADKALEYPRYLRETEIERVNAGADLGVCVIKPPGLGQRRVGYWWMLMSDATWHQLHDVPSKGDNYYRGPTILWFTGSKDVGRAFRPGRWLEEAGHFIRDQAMSAHPGAHKISRAAGGMRFVYLSTGLQLLADCGYGGI